jgi:hypothetical protein
VPPLYLLNDRYFFFSQVFLGALPSDFLRPNNSLSNHNSNHQTDLDQQTALALQNELAGAYSTASSLIQNPVGRLNITVVQVRLECLSGPIAIPR